MHNQREISTNHKNEPSNKLKHTNLKKIIIRHNYKTPENKNHIHALSFRKKYRTCITGGYVCQCVNLNDASLKRD